MALAVMEILLLLLGIVAVLIAVAVVLSRWLWRKGRLGRIALAIFGISIAWPLYEAIYPPESFYVSEFERLTRVSLTTDARFIDKKATFPDLFGDYSACFVVRLSPEGIAALTAQLGEPKETRNDIESCARISKSQRPQIETVLYDLASRATREDAQIYVAVAPAKNEVEISWYLW